MISKVEHIKDGVYEYTYEQQSVARVAAFVTVQCRYCQKKLIAGYVNKPDKEELPSVILSVGKCDCSLKEKCCKCGSSNHLTNYEHEKICQVCLAKELVSDLKNIPQFTPEQRVVVDKLMADIVRQGKAADERKKQQLRELEENKKLAEEYKLKLEENKCNEAQSKNTLS